MKMFLHPQVQFVQLRLVHTAGRFGQQALAALRLGKCDHIADIVRARQQHHQPVQAECDSAVRRRTVFQRLEEKSEPILRLLPGNIQQVKYLRLHLRVMNTNRAAADFRTVDDQVIRLRTDMCPGRFPACANPPVPAR